MQPDIKQALNFLDLLDPQGRHTIASEAPTGGKGGGPKWESGATYEPEQRSFLTEDIVSRQKRGSNVYYSVNEPCRVSKRQGLNGKNNIDDIIKLRAFAFDIDVLEDKDIVLQTIDKKLDGELKPSVVISTGGGYHLIYFLKKPKNINLYRPAKNDKQKEMNNKLVAYRTDFTILGHDFEIMLRNYFPDWKIDNMSNVDRVMRLPGTVNFPKAEKQAKGQVVALSYMARIYPHKIEMLQLINIIPKNTIQAQPEKRPFVPSSKFKATWPAYRRAQVCCEFIKEQGLADTNEWYTLNLMLPLIGAIHDPNESDQITIEEAEELFMLAVSGGARYGTIGRGPGYFKRQWRSHRPEIVRNGNRSLGSLIWASKQSGMKLPWLNQFIWEDDYQKQLKELSDSTQVVPDDVLRSLEQSLE